LEQNPAFKVILQDEPGFYFAKFSKRCYNNHADKYQSNKIGSGEIIMKKILAIASVLACMFAATAFAADTDRVTTTVEADKVTQAEALEANKKFDKEHGYEAAADRETATAPNGEITVKVAN